MGARSECDALSAEVEALRKFMVETNERRDANEAELKQCIATIEAKLEERTVSLEEQRLDNEAKLHARIAKLEQRLENETTGAEVNLAAVSPC